MFFGLMLAAWPAEDEAGRGAGDADLVARAQRGESDAFAALHGRYYSRVYRLAFLKTNNASDAEDIASETFMRALAKLPQFRLTPGGSFYPWLHRIAVNLIVDTCRQRPPSGIVSLDAPLIAGMRDLLADRLDGGESPQKIVERHEVQQLVRSAIASLPDDQGDVLIYRFLGELSLREIVPLMHRSEAAVKSLLHRATVALRTEIARRLDAVERLEQTRGAGERRAKETQHVGRD